MITLDDSAEAPLQNLKLCGKTIQNGIPTLETSAALEGVRGPVRITVRAKNMFDISTVSGNNNVEFKTNGRSIRVFSKVTTGQYHGVKFADMHLKGGITYTISGNVDEYISGIGRFNLRRASDDHYIAGGGVTKITKTGKYSTSYTPTEDIDAYMAIAVTEDATGVKGDITFSNIQMEVGASATDYQPFSESNVTIQIPHDLFGIPVTTGGNYTDENDQQWWCDTVNLGTGKLERRTVHVVLDGTQTKRAFAPSGDTHHRIWFDIGKFEKANGIGTSGMCSHLPNSSVTGKTGWYVTNITEDQYSYIALTLPDSVAGTTETAVLQWLAANPITVVAVRSDIQYEDLSEEELAQYISLHTSYSSTTIFNDSNVNMEVKYATSNTALPISGGCMAGNIDMWGKKLTGVPIPEDKTDAANKDYVDAIDQKIDASNKEISSVRSIAEGANAKVDTLREVVSKFHSNIQETARGEVITVSDASDMELAGLKLYGKTIQNGKPSPDAPIPLESVGESGGVRVTACGRNMIPFPYVNSSGTIKGIEYTVGEDGSVATKGTAEANSVFVLIQDTTTDIVYPKGTYFLSGCPAGGSTSTYSITLRSEMKGDTVQDTGNGALFVLTEASKLHCTIYIKKGTNADGLVFKPMLSVGSSAMPYERKPLQFLEVPTPNGLPGIPVNSGGNYTDDNGQQWLCDEVDLEKNQYVQRVKEMVFDGSDDKGKYNSDYQFLQLSNVADAAKKVAAENFALCAKYPFSSAANADMPDKHCKVHSTSKQVNMYIKDLNYTSTEAWRAHLSANPVTILYQLEKEKPRELTEAEKADYTALYTNYPNSIVFNDSNAGMEVKYVADTKMYVDKKFEELAEILVNKL